MFNIIEIQRVLNDDPSIAQSKEMSKALRKLLNWTKYQLFSNMGYFKQKIKHASKNCLHGLYQAN